MPSAASSANRSCTCSTMCVSTSRYLPTTSKSFVCWPSCSAMVAHTRQRQAWCSPIMMLRSSLLTPYSAMPLRITHLVAYPVSLLSAVNVNPIAEIGITRFLPAPTLTSSLAIYIPSEKSCYYYPCAKAGVQQGGAVSPALLPVVAHVMDTEFCDYPVSKKVRCAQ